MTPGEAYCEFLAITRHFSPKGTYDYHRYGGKVSVKRETFDARPDRWQFEKLAKKKYPRWMIIGSLLDDKKWIGDMTTDEAEERAANRMKKAQGLIYLMGQELSQWRPEGLDGIIRSNNGCMPFLIDGVYRGVFSIETVAAIAGVTGCGAYWDSLDDPVVKNISHKARKYFPFMQADADRVKKIIVDSFTANAA